MFTERYALIPLIPDVVLDRLVMLSNRHVLIHIRLSPYDWGIRSHTSTVLDT